MKRPEITVSTWMPWYTADGWQHKSLNEQLRVAMNIQADVISLKGMHISYVFGKTEFLPAKDKPNSNDVMERKAKALGLGVDLWCWIDCKDPAVQVKILHEAVERWSPHKVDIDCEGWVAKQYAHNTGPFLRGMGRMRLHDGSRVEVFLQSYRRPDLHREIAWEKWLTYTDAQGEYLVDGVSPQAYYMKIQDSVGDYSQMLRGFRALESMIDRKLLWYPTLPTFKEWGWLPTAKSLEDGINFLRAELGDQLVGINFWRLGWLLESTGQEVYEMLRAYDWGEKEPEPEPEPEPIPEYDLTIKADKHCRLNLHMVE